MPDPDEPPPPPRRIRRIRPERRVQYQGLSFDERVSNRLLRKSDLKDVPLELIEAHPLLQREVNEDRSWEIAKSFDPYGHFGIVVEPDPNHPGKYRVLIGQHRMMAAKIMVEDGSLDPKAPVAVAIRPYVSDEDSVRFVRRIEALSRGFSSVEDWHQAVRGNHVYAQPMNEEIERHGIHVSAGYGADIISGVNVLWHMVSAYGWEPEEVVEYLNALLSVTEDAYPIPEDGVGINHRKRWNQIIMHAVFEILARHGLDKVDLSRLTRVVATKPPDNWIREAEEARSHAGGRRAPTWSYVYGEMRKIYNTGLPPGKKLKW